MRWARLLSDLRASGRTMPIKDSMIAATALGHELVVVTRNGADVEKAGVDVIDPFESKRRERRPSGPRTVAVYASVDRAMPCMAARASKRYASVFSRLDALGLKFLGPQAPHGGRQADPWPDELPRDSRNVPTFHSSQQTPATATRQLDFVFASCSVADRIRVCAINAADDWGPSDHCRIEIVIDAS